jgi:hypothetical protein
MLRELAMDLGGTSWIPNIPLAGPVEDLAIAGAAKLAGAPSMTHPSALRVLRISEAAAFDLETLPPEVDLDWLDLDRIGRLLGVRRLRSMSRLRRVVLDRVASVPDADSLQGLTIQEFEVRRSDPAVAAIRDAISDP